MLPIPEKVTVGKCKYCRATIASSNYYASNRRDGQLSLVCDKKSCKAKYRALQSRKIEPFRLPNTEVVSIW